ncbi:MAG: VPS10 domain-containing protein [Nitrospinales bacterium]
MNFQSFKFARSSHKITGFVCAVFIFVLSISGILLMHHDLFGLDEIEISADYLPDEYFKIVSSEPEIQDIAVSANPTYSIFIATLEGIFKSSDGGKTWAQLRKGLMNEKVRSLAINYEDPQIVYAGTANGIYKSEDGGENWSEWIEESSGLTHVDINDLAINPQNPDIIFAGTPGGLYISDDEGESWELSFDGGLYQDSKDVRFIRISPNAKNIYLGTNKFIFKSSDGGDTWERKWENEFSDAVDLISLDTDPEFLYVSTKKGLYKSFNWGITWEKDKEMKSEAIQTIHISPINQSVMYLATENKILFSENGGDHWKATQWINEGEKSSAPLKQLNIIPEPLGNMGKPKLIAGTTDGIFLSIDGGENWNHPNLVDAAHATPNEDMKMDMVKLMTEIHTGRFFGSYFYLLVDIATVGLIFLIFSGVRIARYRSNLAKIKKDKEELEVEKILNIQKTADDLSSESQEIHDMLEHITEHLEKCKTIYMKKEKKEIEQINEHVVIIDKKMHGLMQRIEEFEKLSYN